MSKDYELRLQIKDLEREVEFQKDKCEVKIQKAILEKERQVLDLKKESAGDKATIESLKARIDESPYKLLQEILKALVVKFPTMDLKELSIVSKDKD